MFNFRRSKKITTTTRTESGRMATVVEEEGIVFGLFFVGFTRKIDHDSYSCDKFIDINDYSWLIKLINRNKIAKYKAEHWDRVRLTIPIMPFRFSLKYRSLLGIFNAEHNIFSINAFGVEFHDEQCGGNCIYERSKIVFNNGITKRFYVKGQYQNTYEYKIAKML